MGNRGHLKAALAVQLAIILLVGLSLLGIDVPVLREVVGFVYLTFIPGIIILRIPRINRLGTIKTLLYSIGLSIAFNMFLGLIINFLYPYLGITRPISIFPLLTTWTGVLGILFFIAYRRDRGFSEPVQFNARNLFSAPILLFALLPFLAILGAQLVNSYNNNIVLLLLIAIISLAPVLLITFRVVPEDYYPFIVCMISVSVLFHLALISSSIWGWDTRLEYYMYKVVAANGVWNPIAPLFSYNSVLSVTILPAIYGLVLNIEGTWIFKVIFPLFFSLVPLALFQIFQKQFDRRVAFLAVFFFMAVAPFFNLLLQLGKQLMSEVFFALFLVALLDDKLDPPVKKILVIIFGASIVVSHYATSYLFMLVMFSSYILLLILRKKSAAITMTLTILFIVFPVAWYMYSAGGISTYNLVHLTYNVFNGVGEFFLDPMSRYSFYLIAAKEKVLLHQILVYLYVISQFCIAIGFSVLFLNWLRKKSSSISNEYMVFSAVLFIFMVLSAVMPRLSGITDVPRSFHISLLLLAPFGVYGSVIIIRQAQRISLKLKNFLVQPRHSPLNHISNNLLIPFSIFLLPVFLFTTGFVYEAFNDPAPTSIALSRDKVELAVYSQRDEAGASWIANSRGHDAVIYCDTNSQPLFSPYVGEYIYAEGVVEPLYTGSVDNVEVVSKVPANSYVYLNEFNVKKGRVAFWLRQTDWAREVPVGAKLSSLAFYHKLQESNIIYRQWWPTNLQYEDRLFLSVISNVSMNMPMCKRERRIRCI